MTDIDPEEIEMRRLLGITSFTGLDHAMRHCYCEQCKEARKTVRLIRAAVAAERERIAQMVRIDYTGAQSLGNRDAERFLGSLLNWIVGSRVCIEGEPPPEPAQIAAAIREQGK